MVIVNTRDTQEDVSQINLPLREPALDVVQTQSLAAHSLIPQPQYHSLCPAAYQPQDLSVIVNQKYAPAALAPEPEKTQFPGVRSAISGGTKKIV